MHKPNGTGIGRVVKATECSLAGLRCAFQHESAFRQECALCLVLLPVALWMTQDPIERILLIGPLFVMLIVECINSAIEAAVDRISTDLQPLSKQAKDLGSAAVFLTFLLILLCWGMILGDEVLAIVF